MSYAAIKWSYSAKSVLDAGLNPSELAVLRALCWFYKDEGSTASEENCRVSVERLAQTIGKSTDVVDRAKNALRKKRLIRWDRAPNFSKKNLQANNYIILCPELEKIHKANQEKRNVEKLRENGVDDTGDIEALANRPLKPGEMYLRPDPATLVSAFSPPPAPDGAEWMADALAFVGDCEHTREALHTQLRKLGVDQCRPVLDRCVKLSVNGRNIENRLNYLIKALHNTLSAPSSPSTQPSPPQQSPSTHPSPSGQRSPSDQQSPSGQHSLVDSDDALV